jgi:hypothetical protein
MLRRSWHWFVMCVLLCGGAQAAPKLDPDIYVANRDYPPAQAVTVAIVPFATGDRQPRWGRTLAKQARGRFAKRKFDVVPAKQMEAVIGTEQYSTQGLLSDDALVRLGEKLNADWVVHGKLMDLDTSREAVLGLPVPTGKQAACVIHTKLLDVKEEELLFRRCRDMRREVGREWFTSDSEARARIVRRCMRSLYDPLLERIPQLRKDPYKRRAYLREGLEIDPEETTVAVCRFVDYVGNSSTESVATQAAQAAFSEFGFQLVDVEKLEHACSQLPHDLRETHDDKTLSRLASNVDADVLVYGEIAYMEVRNKEVPLVKFKVPVPGRKEASCVLRTKVIDANNAHVLYRSERKADDSFAGLQWFTSGREARERVARQCVRYLYEEFFRAIELAS